jgi:hypothetical protein
MANVLQGSNIDSTAAGTRVVPVKRAQQIHLNLI